MSIQIYVILISMSYSKSRLSYSKELKEFRHRLSKLSRYQLGYLAGLLDGEGSIALYFDKKRAKEGRITVQSRITLVTNTNKTLVKKVAEWLGEENFYRGRKENQYGGNRKATWVYLIQRKEKARYLLRRLVKHLIAKKNKAEKFIEFVERRRGRKFHPYSKEELDLVKYFKTCNKIGVE